MPPPSQINREQETVTPACHRRATKLAHILTPTLSHLLKEPLTP